MVSDTPIKKVIIADPSVAMRGLLARVFEVESAIEVVASVGTAAHLAERLGGGDFDVVVVSEAVLAGATPEECAALAKAPARARWVLLADDVDFAVEGVLFDSVLQRPKGARPVVVVKEVATQLVAEIVRGSKAANRKRELSAEPPKTAVPPKAVVPSLIAIASSTGGPEALAQLVSAMPVPQLPPIVIVQHMPEEFTSGLATRLSQHSGHIVQEAVEGESVEAGRVYIAPGGFHLTVMKSGDELSFGLNRGPKVQHCRPSADVLFRSIARQVKDPVLAVVLTGMGCDGADGCEELARAGNTVVVQDEASSVVWGMPGSVVRRGLAHYVLPLEALGYWIAGRCEVCVP